MARSIEATHSWIQHLIFNMQKMEKLEADHCREKKREPGGREGSLALGDEARSAREQSTEPGHEENRPGEHAGATEER